MAFTLVPRDWRYFMMPAMRIRAYLRQKISSAGPKGVYRKEWVGIRPSASTVYEISPVKLESCALDTGRMIYFGRRAE